VQSKLGLTALGINFIKFHFGRKHSLPNFYPQIVVNISSKNGRYKFYIAVMDIKLGF
jgi:hypothetical protein